MAATRDLDVVLFGATGFAGKLTAEYLARAAPDEARIGLAGRSQPKLEAVCDELGARAADWPLIAADAADRGALAELAERTTAIATTVGPYRRYGMELGKESDLRGAEYSDELGTWFGPFVMAPVNTRVVRRSNALQDWAYGRSFRYREVMDFGAGVVGRAKALGMGGGLVALTTGLALPPSRLVLDRVLPDPGEGPKEDLVRRGFFVIEIHARTAAGERRVCRVEAQGDPGYGATSVMLGESALCLALDGDRLPEVAGVLTPATGMGAVLADRLRAAGQ